MLASIYLSSDARIDLILDGESFFGNKTELKLIW